MGLFDTIFKSLGSSGTVKVQQKRSDNSVTRGHRYEKAGGGKHVHHSYNLDKATGGYREYRGGENSSDRSYNKKR